MKSLIKMGVAAAAAALLVPFAATPAISQAMSGRMMEDRPRLSVSYYKTAPGKQDEWLALYLKWHRPIMEYQIKMGVTTSSTVYANAGHSLAPQWDFMIINISPPPAKAKKLDKTRGQVIQMLWPDLDAYTAGETNRWALTESHWDQDVMEVDLAATHPGVYYPIIPGKK